MLYHITHEDNLYAMRFIGRGFRDAFRDLGHEFEFVSLRDDIGSKLESFQPDLFITEIHLLPWLRRHDGLRRIAEERRGGLVVAANTPPWEIPGQRLHSLRWRPDIVRLARDDVMPDFFYSWFSEERMREVTERTGKPYLRVPHAADRLLHYPVEPDSRFECDAVYLGHRLRQKRGTFRRFLDPLRHRYDVRVVGRDWTWLDRRLGLLQSASQALGLRVFDGLRSLPNSPDEERELYSSARVCLNFHSDEQRTMGEPCNARTFVVAACGGFQLCDDVAEVREHFAEDEVAVARDERDWIEAMDYYLAHPDERREMATRASATALKHHTYHHRARSLLEMADRILEERRGRASDVR